MVRERNGTEKRTGAYLIGFEWKTQSQTESRRGTRGGERAAPEEFEEVWERNGTEKSNGARGTGFERKSS